MSDFSPQLEHKFTFGLWTVGSRGADPFGSATREHLVYDEYINLGGWKIGFSPLPIGTKP
jgi:xylose isomerase